MGLKYIALKCTHCLETAGIPTSEMTVNLDGVISGEKNTVNFNCPSCGEQNHFTYVSYPKLLHDIVLQTDLEDPFEKPQLKKEVDSK